MHPQASFLDIVVVVFQSHPQVSYQCLSGVVIADTLKGIKGANFKPYIRAGLHCCRFHTTLFFSVPDQSPADAFSNMLFSYMLFSALLITFSFAAPSYVPRDQAFIDWVKLLTEDGGIWKPSVGTFYFTKNAV